MSTSSPTWSKAAELAGNALKTALSAAAIAGAIVWPPLKTAAAAAWREADGPDRTALAGASLVGLGLGAYSWPLALIWAGGLLMAAAWLKVHKST